MATLNFNAATVEPSVSYDPIPKGEYLVMAVASDMRDSKSGGKYLEIELEVIDGNFKGRKIWDRLNLINANPKTQEIANRQLSALCHAANRITVMDSAELHNIPVIAIVTYREASNGYNASNEVRGYKAAGSAPQAPATPPYTPPAYQTQQAPATTGATPPWGRK